MVDSTIASRAWDSSVVSTSSRWIACRREVTSVTTRLVCFIIAMMSVLLAASWSVTLRAAVSRSPIWSRAGRDHRRRAVATPSSAGRIWSWVAPRVLGHLGQGLGEQLGIELVERARAALDDVLEVVGHRRPLQRDGAVGEVARAGRVDLEVVGAEQRGDLHRRLGARAELDVAVEHELDDDMVVLELDAGDLALGDPVHLHGLTGPEATGVLEHRGVGLGAEVGEAEVEHDAATTARRTTATRPVLNGSRAFIGFIGTPPTTGRCRRRG